MQLKDSETKLNLMRAFAGESQARNRYIFAAEQAKKNNLYLLEQVFKFTADQEETHAKIFFDHLKEGGCDNVEFDAAYPVDLSDNVLDLLNYAVHNEYEEHDIVYKAFAEKAAEEGFPKIADSFNKIAKIEKIHGKRFEVFAKLMEENKLFTHSESGKWFCLHCGYVHDGSEAPLVCPVCKHPQGFYIRPDSAPFTCEEKMINN